MQALNDYGDACYDDVAEAVEETGKLTRDEIRANARRYGWKKYPQSWTVKKDNKGLYAKSIVYAGKDGYRIAHLLENGHAKRNGGRVRAYPHIRPAEEKAERTLLKLVSQKIGGSS